jgi:hypothetical protein
MKHYAPRKMTWLVSLILGLISIVGSQLGLGFSWYLLLVAWVLLIIATVIRGL